MDITLTQNQAILLHLKEFGYITPLEALSKYGCMRLASRIAELKQMGFNIETEMVTNERGKKHALYRLKEDTEK